MHPKPSQNCASVNSNLDSIAGRTVEFRIDCYPSELFSAIRNEDVAPDMPKINPQVCHFVDFESWLSVVIFPPNLVLHILNPFIVSRMSIWEIVLVHGTRYGIIVF